MKHDINDTLRTEGEEGVRARHDRAKRYNGSGTDPHFKITPFRQILLSTTSAYLVKDIIPRSGLVIVWGPPKCGKSFWTFDLTMHLALNWQYRSYRTRGGAVVYCAFEGASGFKARVEAFRRAYGIDPDADVPFFLSSARMNLVKDHQHLIAAIRAQIGKTNPVAVVLDTLNRSMTGSESSDEDMTAYLNAADAIREAFGCVVIIVHHCGINGSRPRGHTSLTGAGDAQLAVIRDAAGNIVVTVEWMKDGVEGARIVSRLKPIELGTDEDGETIVSCFLESVEGEQIATAESKPNKRMPKAAKTALRALKEAVDECGEPAPASNHIPAGVRITTIDRWRDYAYRRGISTGEMRAQQKAFKAAFEHLNATDEIGIWAEHVWLAH